MGTSITARGKIEEMQNQNEKKVQEVEEIQENITKQLVVISAPEVSFAVEHLNNISELNCMIQNTTLAIANVLSYTTEFDRSLQRFIEGVLSIAIPKHHDKEEVLARVKKAWPNLTYIHQQIENGFLSVDIIYKDLIESGVLKKNYKLTGLIQRAWISK